MMPLSELQEMAPIKFVKSRRARYLRIAVHPVDGIRVTLPFGVSQRKGEAFLIKKKDWIIKHLTKSIRKNPLTIFDEKTSFATRSHRLFIERNDDKKLSVVVSKDKVLVKFPFNMSVEESEIQNAIRDGIVRALRKEAKEYIPERVKYFAQKFRFKFNKIAIKNAKTRWGSCSSKNNLNFNLHLLRLPQYLIDYVILHELAHTIEKNHGKGFWDLLEKITGGAKVLDKELKKYNSQIW